MLVRKLVTEFIGTFFLVLTIGLAVTGQVEMAALAIGAALMATPIVLLRLKDRSYFRQV